MQSTEKVSLPENSDKSLSEWPTLSDVCNSAKKPASVTTPVKNGRKEGKRNKSSAENNGGYDSSKENEASSETAVNGRGARKKSSLKTKWVPVPIVSQPYKKRGFGRNFYESSRSMNGEKKTNGAESLNGGENGRSNGAMRGYSRFRSKRGRGFSHSWKPREDETSRGEAGKEASDLTFEAECYYNNAIYYDPFLHNMYASALRDKQLTKAIRLQIEYYFSEDNLVKDIFMRRKMDGQGYVPLTLIASFHRVKNLTDDLDTIIEAVKGSSKLEMIDNVKVRPIVDPLKWPLPDTFAALRSDVPEFVPGKPYIAPLIEGLEGLSFNVEEDQFPQSPDSICLTPDQVGGDYINGEPLVNVPFYPDSVSPPEHNVYFTETSGDLFLNSSCEFFSNTPSPDEPLNGFDYYSEPISNGVIYYTPSVVPDESLANGTNNYCSSSPDDVLSTGTDNSTEDTQEVIENNSPEPTR